MKLFLKILILTIIDFVIIWFWVKQNDPDPSISIYIFIVVPFVALLNLALALILYFTKRQYANLFVINAFISAVLMYFLFGVGINNHQKRILESWKFNISDTTFVITHWKLEKEFSISESTNPGSSTSFLDGKFITKNNESYLKTDSTEYIIKNKYLYGFRKAKDSIKLMKIEQ